jgi:hypothetical protein
MLSWKQASAMLVFGVEEEDDISFEMGRNRIIDVKPY